MKFTMLIPWTELADQRPRVLAKTISADSEAAAEAIAEDLANSADKLMDLVVEDWRDEEHLKDLEDADLLREYGVAFGWIEILDGERFVTFVESPFTPSDLHPLPEDSVMLTPMSGPGIVKGPR